MKVIVASKRYHLRCTSVRMILGAFEK